MAVTTIAGKEVHVDDEGFMTEYDEWGEDLAPDPRRQHRHRRELTEDHWQVINFLRSDYQVQGETATLRRVATYRRHDRRSSCSQLFPKKPAKKMSYVSGLPKPAGCV